MIDPTKKPISIQEIERESLDLIKVYNPLDQDFTVRWDGVPHVVPNKNKDIGHGNGIAIMVRYIAKHYAKHITDFIILRAADTAVKAENERRLAHGMKRMTKYEEQPEFEHDFSHRDLRRRLDIYTQVWKGTYQKHGGELMNDVIEEDILPKTDQDIINYLEDQGWDEKEIVPETPKAREIEKTAVQTGKKKEDLIERVTDENN